MTGPALEARWLLWALALGAGLGLLYGFLRWLRPRFLGDLIFVGAAFAAWIYLGFGICEGRLRFGYTMGLAAGAIAWECSIGGLLRPVFRWFWGSVRKIMGIFLLPLRKIFRKIFKKLKKFFKLLLAGTKKWVTIEGDYIRPGKRAAGGVTHGKEKTPLQAGAAQEQQSDRHSSGRGRRGVYRHPHRPVRRHRKRPAGS